MTVETTKEVQSISREAIITRCLNMVTDNEYSLSRSDNPKDRRRYEYNIAFYGGIAKHMQANEPQKVININIASLVKEINTTSFDQSETERQLTEIIKRAVANAESAL